MHHLSSYDLLHFKTTLSTIGCCKVIHTIQVLEKFLGRSTDMNEPFYKILYPIFYWFFLLYQQTIIKWHHKRLISCFLATVQKLDVSKICFFRLHVTRESIPTSIIELISRLLKHYCSTLLRELEDMQRLFIKAGKQTKEFILMMKSISESCWFVAKIGDLFKPLNAVHIRDFYLKP